MKFYLNKSYFKNETLKEIDGNDFLIAYDVPIAKTGIQQYSRRELSDFSGNPDEMVNVYRDESVFEDEKLLETFDGIPIVYEHPDSGKVDHENFKEYIVGTVSGVYYKDGSLYAKKITIIDREVIKNVLNKQNNELSIGFRGTVTKTKGKHKGIHYEFKENVIHANHLAMCESGKAGSYYAINSKRKEKKMFTTNSVEEEHKKMKDSIKGGADMDFEKNVEGLVEQAVKKHMSKVKAVNFDNKDEELEEEELEEDIDEPKKKEKKEKKEMKHLEDDMDYEDESDPILKEKDDLDRNVVNSLKRSLRKYKDLVNSKNVEIRKLELKNIKLEEHVTEASEYIKNMAGKLNSMNLRNAMAGPNHIAGINSPKSVDMCNGITQTFLYK